MVPISASLAVFTVVDVPMLKWALLVVWIFEEVSPRQMEFCTQLIQNVAHVLWEWVDILKLEGQF